VLQAMHRALRDAKRLGHGPDGQVERREQPCQRRLPPRTAALADARDAVRV